VNWKKLGGGDAASLTGEALSQSVALKEEHMKKIKLIVQAYWKELIVALFMVFVGFQLIEIRSQLSSIDGDVYTIKSDVSSIESDVSSIERMGNY
jgi:hypothetical protein